MKVLGRCKFMLGVVALVLATAFLGCTPQASAEEIPERRIQISPATIELGELEPGETKEVDFKVQNTGTTSFKYEVSATPYSVVDENYTQSFTATDNYADIAEWITFSQTSGEIEPDQQDEITATIKVPSDVPAGGQYAAIMVRMLNDTNIEDNNAGVGIYNQVGLVIYSNVAGNTRKEGSITENKVPSFMFAPPISATSIVENKGNVHADATYILQVYPFFGGDEVYTNEENPETHTILPETRRLNTMTWEGAPHLGIFKVKQTVKFLDQTSVTEKVLFICPIWFLLIILAIIFLVIFWIITRVRGGRKE